MLAHVMQINLLQTNLTNLGKKDGKGCVIKIKYLIETF